MKQIFTAFKFQGVEYIAIPRGENVTILSRGGDCYGTWMSIEKFKKGIDGERTMIGKGRLVAAIEQE